MVNIELVQIINKKTDAGIPDGILLDELRSKLMTFINDLIINDFQRLLTILYRVDVNESRLKTILKEKKGKDAADVIAGLIIERELQKIETRKQFRKN